MRLKLVYNPAAGAGKGEARMREARTELDRVGITAEAVATTAPGHATELARELGAEEETLLVLGGDGTLSEAANGVLELPDARRPRLGFLPAGRGNDFLRDFGVGTIAQAAQAIAQGRTRPADMMRVRWQGPQPGHRHLLNVFGTGLMAHAGQRAGDDWRWLGRKGYDVAAFIEILTLKPTPTGLVLDGAPADGDYPLVAVCNSSCTGGGMRLAPDARPDDGWLDVVTIEGATRAEMLKLLAVHVRNGTHVTHPKVAVRRARKVTVHPGQPSPLLLDGEIGGMTPVDIDVLPGAIDVLVP